MPLEFNNNKEWVYSLSVKELSLLCDFIMNQYISYENTDLLILIKNLIKTNDELAEHLSSTT